MEHKYLIMLRGLPGSGKTALATVLSEGKYPVLSEDDYYHESDGTYRWTVEKEVVGKQQCLEDTTKALQTGVAKVFVTNVFLFYDDLQPYLEIAQRYGYRYSVVVVENTHGNKSVHNVKPEDFEQMKRQFEFAL